MGDRRVRTALRDALNGDAETVDPPVRRGLIVLAVAQDDADESRLEFEQRIEQKVDTINATVDSLKRFIAGTGVTIVTTIAIAAGAVVTRL